MNELKITRTAHIAGEYDTVVCGAGPAGWIAAVGAARMGMKTALIERFGFFGGTATSGLVVPISGFYLNGRQTVGGIPFEFIKRLEAAGGALIELPRGHISFDPEKYKLIAQRMVLEAGVDVYTNSYAVDCLQSGDDELTTLFFENKNGLEAVNARCFIDASGDGDICRMANVEFLPDAPEGLQPMSACFLIGGVDLSTDLLKNCIHHNGLHGSSCNAVIHGMLNEAVKTGNIRSFGGPWFNTVLCGDHLAVNITRCSADARDNRSLRDAEFTMREDMFAIVELLRMKYSEFKNCCIVSSAMQAGIRETNRIKGLYTMTGNDLLTGAEFDDRVALCAHPVDIHSTSDVSQICQRLERTAGVPYRAMVTPKYKNLIVAGRTVSADRVAYASLRVQGTLMAIGQAAAVASKLTLSEGDCRTVSAEHLKADLVAGGAIIDL